MGAFHQRQALGLAQLPCTRALDTPTQVLGDCEVMAVDQYAVHFARIIFVDLAYGVMGPRLASGRVGMLLVVATKAEAAAPGL